MSKEKAREAVEALKGLMKGLDYEAQKAVVAAALEFVDPSKAYGPKLFNGLARVTVTPAIEAVALRKRKGRIQVFLTQRAQTESAYPGQWHCPGTTPRPGESDQSAFERLTKGAFKSTIIKRKMVDVFNHPQEARGHYRSEIYLVQLKAGPEENWFNLNELPQPMVQHHLEHVIPIALRHFKQ